MKWQRVAVAIGAFLLFSAGQVFAGTIQGQVKFSGEPPKAKLLDTSVDPMCKQGNTQPLYSEALVLGADKSMANVFVRIKSGVVKKDFPAPKEDVNLDQKGCHYVPHVVGVMKGQNLKIRNSDGTLHNVHAFSKTNPPFNMAMPESIKEKDKVFRQTEPMFNVKCDVHPWMEAWIGVVENPFFAVTKSDGQFKIDGLDAGTYEIEAWHEKLGTQTQKVTIGAADSKTVSFTFAMKK